MSVTIWHNQKCSTSRQVLATIRAKGIEPTIVEYLKTPPSAAEIRTVLKELGIGAYDLLRHRSVSDDLPGLSKRTWSDSQVVAAMVKNPALIERPVVRARKGTRLCRPASRLNEIL